METTELRFIDGPRGYFKLCLHGDNGIKAIIALRHCGLGLCWTPTTRIFSAPAMKFDDAEKALIKANLARKRFWSVKTE